MVTTTRLDCAWDEIDYLFGHPPPPEPPDDDDGEHLPDRPEWWDNIWVPILAVVVMGTVLIAVSLLLEARR